MDAADAAENGTAAAATTSEVAPPVPPPAAAAIEDTAATAGGGAVVADAAVAETAKTGELPVVEKTTDLAVKGVVDADKGDAKKGGKEGKEEEDDDPDKGKTVGTGKLLFKYATWLDIFYMFLGTCSAIVCG